MGKVKIFNGILGTALYGFFLPFSPPPRVNCAHSGIKRSIPPVQVKYILSLTMKTDEVTSDTREVDPHERLVAIQVQGRIIYVTLVCVIKW